LIKSLAKEKGDDCDRSWTFTHQDPSYGYKEVYFGGMCTEIASTQYTREITRLIHAQRFAFWAGVGLAGMEALQLLIFAVWWFKDATVAWLQKGARRQGQQQPKLVCTRLWGLMQDILFFLGTCELNTEKNEILTALYVLLVVND
jgi:hypothetical protein